MVMKLFLFLNWGTEGSANISIYEGLVNRIFPHFYVFIFKVVVVIKIRFLHQLQRWMNNKRPDNGNALNGLP